MGSRASYWATSLKIPAAIPWNVSPEEALGIQKRLRERVILHDTFQKIEKVAGADVSLTEDGELAHAVVVVLSFPDLQTIEMQSAAVPVTFPYIPGLLAFREAPALLEAFRKVQVEPDIILFDGHGVAHPRRLGIASHMGVLLDRPSIGCAKSRLVGRYAEPSNEVGAYTPLLAEGNELIGYAVRTRRFVRPIFVSPGHRVSFGSALRIALQCCAGYRLPEPIRRAHNYSQAIQQDVRLPGSPS